MTEADVARARQRLLDLTREVQQHDVPYQGQGRVAAWMDLISVAAHRDDLRLNTAEALITGPGWQPGKEPVRRMDH